MSAPKVFRDEVKEPRESYYVIYQPADANLPFAHLTLVFPENDYDTTIVANAMEKEFVSWLMRYPVPLMVSACDPTESVIHNPNKCGESHIMGYLDLHSGKTIWQWGLLENEELPKEQMDSEYLARIYDGIPFRLQADVHKVAESENRKMAKVGIAHRLPMYAVPSVIAEGDADRYQQLEKESIDALMLMDVDKHSRLKQEQVELTRYVPILCCEHNGQPMPLPMKQQVEQDVSITAEVLDLSRKLWTTQCPTKPCTATK